MFKSFYIPLFLNLLLCQLNTHCAVPLLGSLGRTVLVGAGRLASTGLRTGGARVADELRKDPKAAAAGVAGGYIGYQAAGGSKIYGALGGGITGYCLVKRHADVRTLQNQLHANAAQVSAFQTEAQVELATLRARLGSVSQAVKQLDNRLRTVQQELKKAAQTKVVSARKVPTSVVTQQVQKTATINPPVQSFKTDIQARLAALKERAQQAALLRVLSVV